MRFCRCAYLNKCASLKTLNIPKSLKQIVKYSLDGCKALKNIELPEGLESIGSRAFGYCTSLKELAIPSTVTKIESGAFYYSELERLVFLSDTCEIEGENISSAQTVICCRKGSTAYTYAQTYNKPFELLEGEYIPPENGEDNNSDELTDGQGGTDNTNSGETPSTHSEDESQGKTDPSSKPDEAEPQGEEKQPVCPHKSTELVPVKAASLTESGKARLVCKSCGATLKTVITEQLKSIGISEKALKYDGKSHKPTAVIKSISGKSIGGGYFTVEYYSRKKNQRVNSIKEIGQYLVKVKLRGCYSGEKQFYVFVKPSDIKSFKVKRSKTEATVTWRADSAVSGYELVIAENKSFSKGKRTVVIKKAKTAKRLVKSLKKGKTYYFRLRSYKNIKVNGVPAVMYSVYTKTVKK